MGEQNQLGKTKLYWAEDVKDITMPNVPVFEWHDVPNEVSVSLGQKIDTRKIRKLLYTRIPRKLKKRQKKIVSLCDGKPVKHLRYDYLGTYYWIK